MKLRSARHLGVLASNPKRLARKKKTLWIPHKKNKTRKNKNKIVTDDAPKTKKRKTKSSKKDRAAPTEPLVVEPISVARPASEHRDHQLIVHEPAFTEAPEAEDIPAVDPTAAEDIGFQDNVDDDEVLPQIKHHPVSSPVLTNSELISIGRPLTPIAQDDSWADRPQDSPIHDETPRTPPPQVTSQVL